MPWASNPEKRFRLSPSAPKFPRVWPIGWASDRQSGQRSSILRTRSRNHRPCKHRWRCAGPVIRKSQFESGTGLHHGKAQAVELAKFKCGQVNRCHAGLISHASGVQLASPQPGFGESFNGRTAGLQPANEGSIPSSSTRFAREAVARVST